MMMGGFGAGYGMGLIGPVLMFGFWVLVVLGVVVLARWLLSAGKTRGVGTRQEDSALEILRKRYAQGEIDRREFEEKRRFLTG